MSIYLDQRTDESFALYIDGDFQFDSSDEALYHESLALPALTLARPHGKGLRVLMCGGGDGLALRECLRFPKVSHVDLVDCSDEVVQLGRTRLSQLNRAAFDDRRVRVHIRDAWEFLARPGQYDVIICDFTVPRKREDTRVFSLEWYERLKGSLTPGGVMAINAVSPQVTPEAFWCLSKTIKAAGLKTVPYHVCIPSFREHGYGAWGFILAGMQSNTRIHAAQLKGLLPPVETRQADLTKLWRGARFKKTDRRLEQLSVVNTTLNCCLLPLLLNPGSVQYEPVAPDDSSPYDLNPLLRAIPISHPYHTRTMVETLAEQVAGAVRELDIKRLVEALLRRAAALPSVLLAELNRLRDFIADYAPRFELFSKWSYRLFAALVIMMTLANAISPDNAFAKGSFGSGAHGGFSVGHSSFSTEGSFHGSPGSSSSGFSSSGSFGGARGVSGTFGRTGSFSSRSSSEGSGFAMSTPTSPHFTGSGFRSSYGRGRAVDIYGTFEPSRSYYYCGSGYGHYHGYTQVYGGQRPPAPPEKHESQFLASDDMSVLDNGDVVINVAQNAYLLLTNGTVALMNSKSPDPLMLMYPDPSLFNNVGNQLYGQQINIQNAIESRRDWLSWVGWTSAMIPAVSGDRQELKNLQDLQTRLDTAMKRLGQPPAGSATSPPTPGQTELFIGAILNRDSSVSLRDARGKWITTDGTVIRGVGTDSAAGIKCPPLLSDALSSAIVRMRKDVTGGIAFDNHDMQMLEQDYASLQRDLSQYESLQQVNYGDPNYEVDYGTDEIPVWDALARTHRDLTQNESDRAATQRDIEKLQLDLSSIDTASMRFGAKP